MKFLHLRLTLTYKALLAASERDEIVFFFVKTLGSPQELVSSTYTHRLKKTKKSLIF